MAAGGPQIITILGEVWWFGSGKESDRTHNRGMLMRVRELFRTVARGIGRLLRVQLAMGGANGLRH